MPELPPLTKATAIEWAAKAVVPIILLTDPREWNTVPIPPCNTSPNKPVSKAAPPFLANQ